jgi:MoxR-like ATPase
VSDIVPRAQLESAAALIPTLKIPMLVHAAGGVGKTVFMESLAKTLEVRFETIFLALLKTEWVTAFSGRAS